MEKKYHKQNKKTNNKWEKMFAICITNKRLMFAIHKDLSKIEGKKINTQIGKWAKEMNRQFEKYIKITF